MEKRMGDIALDENDHFEKEGTKKKVEEDNPLDRKELQFSTIAANSAVCQSETINRTSHGRAICTSTVYEFDSLEEQHASRHMYRRFGSPNSEDMAHVIACLECAEAGLATSSGMGAVVSTVLSLMKVGDTVLVQNDAYGGTYSFFDDDVRRFGMNVEFIDVLNVVTLESAVSQSQQLMGSDGSLLVFCESITNPLIRVADVPAISRVCKKFGALLIVDNTFSTPLRTKPLLQGADLVIHSATKFLGGHSDVLAGAVVGSANLVKRAKGVAVRWGLMVSAFDAWLCTRSIRTLQIRLERAWNTSEKLSERVKAEKHAVLKVHAAPKCAVFSFVVVGGLDGAKRVFRALDLIKLASSLGGVTTTVSHPASTSHVSLGITERERLGIPDGLIRISIGVEDLEDLSNDLLPAVRAAGATL